MDSGFISVSSVDSFFVLVQIQLIQAENDGDIFGLPLLLVGILIMHAQAGHYLGLFRSWVAVINGSPQDFKSPITACPTSVMIPLPQNSLRSP